MGTYTGATTDANGDPNNNQSQPGSSSNQTQPGVSSVASTQPGTSSPSSNSTPGTASASSGASPYTPTKSGTGFTNIQKMIGANSNNQLGNAVGGGVTQTAQQAGDNINQSQNNFLNDSNSANLNTDANRNFITNTYSNIQNQAMPNAGGATNTTFDSGSTVNPNAGGTAASSSTAAPATPVSSPSNTAATPYAYTSGQYDPSQDQSKFSQFTSGQYNGPTQLGNLNNLQVQSSDVNNLQNSLNSQEGRQGLLQRFVGGNNPYSSGEQNLDALILGQTGGQQLNQARLAAQALPDLSNLAQADQGVAQSMQQGAKDLANYTTTGAQKTGANIQDYLKNQASTQSTSAQTQLQQLQSDALSGKLNSGEASQLQNLLGLSGGPAYGQQQTMINDIFGNGATGTTLGTGGALSAAQYNANNVANQNQYAAQQALQSLSGQNATQLGLNIDQSQIGKAPTSPIAVNSTLAQELKSNQDSSNNQFNSQLASAGLSLPEYQYLTGQDGSGALSGLNQAYQAMYNTPLDGSNDVDVTGAANAPLIQQAIASLQGYDNTNGSQAFNNEIQQLQGITTANMRNGGGISSYQTPLDSVTNALTGLQSQATPIGTNNHYFNSLASLLAGPKATAVNGGPGRQVIPS